MPAQVGCCLQVEVRFEHCQDGLPKVVGFDVGATGWLIMVSWFHMPCRRGFFCVPEPRMWACICSSQLLGCPVCGVCLCWGQLISSVQLLYGGQYRADAPFLCL